MQTSCTSPGLDNWSPSQTRRRWRGGVVGSRGTMVEGNVIKWNAVSPVRWLRAFAVLGATALLLASSCTWQLGTPIPRGVPPPRGAPVPPVDTHAKGRPADQLYQWA